MIWRFNHQLRVLRHGKAFRIELLAPAKVHWSGDGWQTVIESVGTLKIDASCQLLLKAWITNGVERMENEDRLTPKDIATANENLKAFIALMKAEELSLGTDRLDNKCFQAAQHKLEQHSLLTVFSLWPFWPHAVTR